MKQTVTLMLAFATLAICSCAKAEEEVVVSPVSGAAHTLVARIDNPETKTLYEESGSTAQASWVQDDELKLLVYSASDGSKAANFYRYRAQATGPEVEFACVGIPNFNSYPRAGVAVYPSDLTIGGKYGAYTVTLPSSYTVSGTDLSRVKVPLMGTTTPDDGEYYTFKTAVGVLKVTLTQVPVEARKLVITSSADNLSGVFPLNLSEGLVMTACQSAAGHSITVNFDRHTGGSTLNLYVPVPVGSISIGATFDVQKADGTSLKKVTTGAAIPIQRGHLKPLAAIPVSDSPVSPIAIKASMVSVNVDAGNKAGSYHYDGSGKAALVDGDISTFWHTPWQAMDENYYNWSDLDATYGAFIDIDLGPGKSITEFDFHACLRNSSNDFPKHVVLYAKPEGGDWEQVNEVSNICAGISAGSWIQPISCTASAPARFIRFSIVENTSGKDLRNASAKGCTHLAEIELYGEVDATGGGSQWLSLFSDLSCSELKAGVTEADIQAMYNIAPDYLAENVAMPLFNGTYTANDQDFRIHSYEPYSDNRVCPATLFSRIYTAMDNPTGIMVESGHDITVCVDQIPEGQTVSLAIYGDLGDLPNYGGGDNAVEGYDQNIELGPGINHISITASGMAYVLNTITQTVAAKGVYDPITTPVSSFKPVKVHILPGSGSVQGYYDPSRHSEARGAEILVNYSYKYFMVKGQKVCFLFHTQSIKNRGYSIPDLHSGIDTWDQVAGWQQALTGLDQKAWFNNHIMAVTTTSTASADYMNASHRRLLFGIRDGGGSDAFHQIYSTQALLDNEGGWGPFHEMGHIHQNAINWKSTSESSNNLFSNYCKMMLANEAGADFVSRGSRIYDLAQSYASAKPWVLLGDATYQSEDTELHMRMNWQLWNYYHRCGHNPSFWPNLFEYLRQHPLHSDYGAYYHSMGEDPGLAQLEFYEACCTVAGEDLTEFFDVWGFFRPVDNLAYYQYGDITYNVTEEMIAASKARVAAMNLPKAAPIQYLEDRSTAPYSYKYGNTTITEPDYVYSQLGYFTQFQGTAATVPENVIIEVINTAAVVQDNAILNAVALELREGESSSGTLLYFSNKKSMTIPDGVSFTGNSLWAVQADGKRVKLIKH